MNGLCTLMMMSFVSFDGGLPLGRRISSEYLHMVIH